MKAIVTAMLVLALSGLVAATPGADCTCAASRLANGWCESCQVGYVASIRIKSWLLYETLDAHGHDIDPDAIECRSCQAALKIDGLCKVCRWGFVDKKLYYSPLTFYLARGEVKDLAKLTCRPCAANAAKIRLPLDPHRWCDRCRIGMVGNVAFNDRKEFDAASRELDRLLRANRLADHCEFCAMALFEDTTCPKCNIAFKDGKKVATEPTEPAPHAHPHPH